MENNVQFLNRITLRGYVGAVNVNPNVPFIRLQIVTNFGHKYSNEGAVIETTWLPAVFFPPKDKLDRYRKIKKGDAVKVIGRLRNFKKILENGQEINEVEVYASSLQKLKANNSLLLQV